MGHADAEPAVRVVVTCFNKESFIADTVKSVHEQSYPHVELIVVDDGSTDSSAEVLASYLAVRDGRVVTLNNGGVSRARNVGASSGAENVKYLLFLDGDDLLETNSIERLVDYMESNPSVSLVYSIPTLIDEFGAVIEVDPDQRRWTRVPTGRREVPFDDPSTPLESIWARFRALPSGSLIRAQSFAATSGWDSSLCRPARPFHAEDKDMAIQLALVGEVHRLPESLFRYRMLPTPHRTALYEGLAALNAKWWNLEQERPQRLRVRRAIRFDARVTVLDACDQWLQSVRRRGDVGLRHATAHLAAATARWIAQPIRLRGKSYLG